MANEGAVSGARLRPLSVAVAAGGSWDGGDGGYSPTARPHQAPPGALERKGWINGGRAIR